MDSGTSSVLQLQQRAALNQRQLSGRPAVSRNRADTIRDLRAKLVVDMNLPLTVFENQYMQELFHLYDPTLDSIASSHWSIRQDIDKLYMSYKEVLYKDLNHALTRIHLSFDMWTSPNNKAMMAVTAHYIDLSKRHQSCLLGLRQHEGDHSGARLSQTLSAVVSEWGLTSREIGVVIADNATSNDTCLEHFWQMTDPDLSPSDIKHRRVRCYGHILNLVAKAFFSARMLILSSSKAAALGQPVESRKSWSFGGGRDLWESCTTSSLTSGDLLSGRNLSSGHPSNRRHSTTSPYTSSQLLSWHWSWTTKPGGIQPT